jgi:hypothetical protein
LTRRPLQLESSFFRTFSSSLFKLIESNTKWLVYLLFRILWTTSAVKVCRVSIFEQGWLTLNIAAFEDFLKTFKSSSTEAIEALERLNLEDNLDEEYDFMDESGDETGRVRRADPKLKYSRVLQQVADRQTNHITIDLDDLAAYENAMDYDEPLQLVASIERNAFHYIEIFSRAVDKVMPPARKELK